MADQIKFKLVEQDMVRANQIHWLREVTSKRAFRQIAFTLLAISSVVLCAELIQGKSLRCAAITAGLIGTVALAVAMPMSLISYVFVTRTARRLFRQTLVNNKTAEANWSSDGLKYKSEAGAFSLKWSEHHSWRGEKVGYLFYLNEGQFYLLPNHGLNGSQRLDLESTLARSGLLQR